MGLDLFSPKFQAIGLVWYSYYPFIVLVIVLCSCCCSYLFWYSASNSILSSRFIINCCLRNPSRVVNFGSGPNTHTSFSHAMKVVMSPYIVTQTGSIVPLRESPGPSTKRQSVVSCSSAKAKYKSISSTISEIIWVRWLLSELDVHSTKPTPLFRDN